MFSRKFRYSIVQNNKLHLQFKVWYWPFWIDVYSWDMEWFIKGWIVNPTEEWKYLDENEMRKYV